MKQGTQFLHLHYRVSMRFTRTMVPISKCINPSPGTSAVLLSVDTSTQKLVPKQLQWSEMQYPTEWVIEAPQPTPVQPII